MLSNVLFTSDCIVRLDMYRIRLLLTNMKILQLNTHGKHIVLYAAVERTRVLIDL
jgi:hypothetical protein